MILLGIFKRKKSFFYSIHAEDSNGNYSTHKLIGALTDKLSGQFPIDMGRILSICLVVQPKNVTYNLSWATSYHRTGEAKNTNVGAGSKNGVSVIDQTLNVDMSGAFVSAVKQQFFGITVTGFAVLTQHILGIELIYK